MTLSAVHAINRAFNGDSAVLTLPARGREVGVRGGGDGRDPRLLAARRGSLSRQIVRCEMCRFAQDPDKRMGGGHQVRPPEWAVGATSAVLGPPGRFERLAWPKWFDLDRVSWLPVEACGTHRAAMLDAAGVEFVLLWGRRALYRWRPDLDWKASGRIGVWAGRWVVMPVIDGYAPKSALRRWARLVMGGLSVGECVADTCVRCAARMSKWDDDGVAWCEWHYNERKN